MTASDPTIEPYIAFSDSVIREAGTGKLSLIGTFETWNGLSFPFFAPAFVMTVRITNLVGKVSKARVTLRIEEPGSGHVIASTGAEITTTNELTRDDALELPLRIEQIQFPHPGTYEVVVLLNNEPLGKRKFKVNTITQGLTPPDIKEDT